MFNTLVESIKRFSENTGGGSLFVLTVGLLLALAFATAVVLQAKLDFELLATFANCFVASILSLLGLITIVLIARWVAHRRYARRLRRYFV